MCTSDCIYCYPGQKRQWSLTSDVEGSVIALVDQLVVLVQGEVGEDAVGFLRGFPVQRERVWVRNCIRGKDFLRSYERIDMKLIHSGKTLRLCIPKNVSEE